MKTFTRKRTLDEIRAICAEKGWMADTAAYDRNGGDYLPVRFNEQGTSGHVFISTVTGEFHGHIDGGGDFTSESRLAQKLRWFNAILDVVLTNDPPAAAVRASADAAPADYGALYEKFWKPLLEKDGTLDLDAVKRELFDFHALMHNAAIVYCHVTGNRISKVNTDPDAVCAVADDIVSEAVREALRDAAGRPGYKAE